MILKLRDCGELVFNLVIEKRQKLLHTITTATAVATIVCLVYCGHAVNFSYNTIINKLMS